MGGVGVGHVGYYPHYHPGVGYYHLVARAAAWDAAYNRVDAYGGYNQSVSLPNGRANAWGLTGDGTELANPEDKKRAADAEAKLDAELNADKNKDKQ